MPGDELLRITRRPWRIAFIIYAALLTIATHWPALQLPEEAPATDKTLHAAAFALGTWLLWRTAWTHTLWLALLIALGWASVDEVTQMIPGLNRWVAWPDFIANVCGVVIAGVWIWTLRPIGNHVNRRRQARWQYMFDHITCDRTVICVVIGVVLLHISIAAVAWVSAAPGVTRVTIIVLALALPASIVGVVLYHWPRLGKRIAQNRPCFVCQELHRGTWTFGVRHRCAECGCLLDEDQWKPAKLRTQDRRGVRRVRIAVIVGAMIVGLLCLALAVPDIAAIIGGMPLIESGTIGSVLILTFLLVALAAGVYIARVWMARACDAYLSCRHCGHDLRGIVTTATGVGKCSACSTLFRMREF